jgi:hypothetical protein
MANPNYDEMDKTISSELTKIKIAITDYITKFNKGKIKDIKGVNDTIDCVNRVRQLVTNRYETVEIYDIDRYNLAMNRFSKLFTLLVGDLENLREYREPNLTERLSSQLSRDELYKTVNKILTDYNAALISIRESLIFIKMSDRSTINMNGFDVLIQPVKGKK